MARRDSAPGYRSAVLESLSVWHRGSLYCSKPNPPKNPFHQHKARLNACNDFVRRMVSCLSATALNARYSWFDPPNRCEPPIFGENRS